MDTTTFDNKVTELVAYLDARIEPLNGYALSLNAYNHGGPREFVVQPFPHTVEDGQAVADALGVTFVQDDDPRWRYRYTATRNGVQYNFHLSKTLDAYPAQFTPAESDLTVEQLAAALGHELPEVADRG